MAIICQRRKGQSSITSAKAREGGGMEVMGVVQAVQARGLGAVWPCHAEGFMLSGGNVNSMFNKVTDMFFF